MTDPTSHSRPAAAGFTLVELLAVLVLLGIGVAMAAPRMDGMAARNKTESAVARLNADLAYARVLAVRWGRPTSVRFNATGSEYTISVDTAGASSPNYRVVKTVRVSQEYPGVTLSSPSSQVSFTPRGMVYPDDSGRFTAARGSVADSLRLYPTGRIYRAN